MRPVVRGDVPIDANGGQVTFAEYGDASRFLIERIGDYCSYCENVLPSTVDVEHVQPKQHHPDLELTWENFLLACSYCNRAKWHTDVDLNDYFWPDRDNTYRAFVYELDQPPRSADDISPRQVAIANRTITLTGLDRVPGHAQLGHHDRRYIKRKEAWGIAIHSLQELRARRVTPMSVVMTAISRGFFSVWMTVFREEPEMRKLFIENFRGTARASCFDADTNPRPRLGGLI